MGPVAGVESAMKLTQSIEIACPPERVFAFLSDPGNLPRWQSSVEQVRRESPSPGVGARHVEVRSLLGRAVEQTLEMTAYEPPTRLDLAVIDGPLKLRVSHTLAPTPGGTLLEVVGEGQIGGPLRLLEPVLVAAVKAQGEQDLARLREVLEEGSLSPRA